MKNMTLLEWKKIVDEEVAKGNGDAVILVQAYEDGISNIVITGYEGCGSEFGDGPLVFSLESGHAQNNAITCEECKNFGTVNCSETYREPTADDSICESFVGEV